MTPYQMAKHECANMLANGSCLGLDVTLPKCLLAENKPCRFFEKYVLPLSQAIPQYLDVPASYLKLLEAASSTPG